MQSPRTSKFPRGASLIIASSLFYASYGIWTELMGNAFGGYTASALRATLVVSIFVLIAAVYHKFEPIKWHIIRKYFFGMTLASIAVWGPFYYSILHIGVGVSLTVNYTGIVLGSFFFGWALGKERLTKIKSMAAILGLFGLGLVCLPSIHNHIELLALGAGLLSGVASAANIYIEKQLPFRTVQTSIIFWAIVAVTNIPMAFIFHEVRPPMEWTIGWLSLVIFAVASAVASGLFIKGVKFIDVGVAGILGLLEIVFGIAFGIILFHERPSMVVLAGGAAIIASVAIPYFQNLNIGRTAIRKLESESSSS